MGITIGKKLSKKIKSQIEALTAQFNFEHPGLAAQILIALAEKLQAKEDGKKQAAKDLEAFLDKIRKNEIIDLEAKINAIIEQIYASKLPAIQYFEQNPQALDPLATLVSNNEASVSPADKTTLEFQAAVKALDDALKDEKFSSLIQEIHSTLKQLTEIQADMHAHAAQATENPSAPSAPPTENLSTSMTAPSAPPAENLSTSMPPPSAPPAESTVNSLVPSYRKPESIHKEQPLEQRAASQRSQLIEHLGNRKAVLRDYLLNSDELRGHLNMFKRRLDVQGYHKFLDPRHAISLRVCQFALQDLALDAYSSHTTIMDINKQLAGLDRHFTSPHIFPSY